jgi:hypothetical protein
MPTSKFTTLPSEIRRHITSYFSIQDLICLYKTSRFWKHSIDNDKLLWRCLYERMFGRGLVEDSWLLWAVRRLWSQSPLEEKRLAARHVYLTTLEHLDASTWRRLVRGRILTEKNWRNNTPQRSIFFTKEQLHGWRYGDPRAQARIAYGMVFASERHNGLGFAIVDDTLNNTSSTPNIQIGNITSSSNNLYQSNVSLGKVVPSDLVLDKVWFDTDVPNEEFIVTSKSIDKDIHDATPPTEAILVWDFGQLEIHQDTHQSYCIPRPCMFEILPSSRYLLLEHQRGWLLVQSEQYFIDKHTRQSYQQYIIYDIRRGHIAAAFALRENVYPIIGQVTLDKIQIYYSYTKLNVNSKASEKLNNSCCWHDWYSIEVRVLREMQRSNLDLTWCHQTPTPDVMKSVKEKYRMIEEHVIEHEYWCNEGYALNASLKGTICLPACIEAWTKVRHLINDVFLIESVTPYPDNQVIFTVHSTRLQRILWSKPALTHSTFIPGENVIFNYEHHGIAQLLDVYTGDILNSFKLQRFKNAVHIIGPLCCLSRGAKHILLDVRTGKEIRRLDQNQVAHPFLDVDLQSGVECIQFLKIPGPTRVEYIYWEHGSVWTDEYAYV